MINPFIEGDQLARKLDRQEDDHSSSFDDSGGEEESAVKLEDDDSSGQVSGWGGDWQGDNDYDNEGKEALPADDKNKIDEAGNSVSESTKHRSYARHTEVDGKWKCRHCEKRNHIFKFK